MSDISQSLQRLSPEKLTTTFSRSNIFRWLIIAVVAHAVLLAATSASYIRDTWIDPQGAARRKVEKLAAEKAEAERAVPRPAPGAAGADGKTPAKPSSKADGAPGTSEAAGRTPEEIEMAKRKGARVIEEITKKAKKDEIPKEPDGLGISIDETNR